MFAKQLFDIPPARGHYVAMFDAVYKLRYQKTARRKWEAAAKLAGDELSEWMRGALDDKAQENISRFQE